MIQIQFVANDEDEGCTMYYVLRTTYYKNFNKENSRTMNQGVKLLKLLLSEC